MKKIMIVGIIGILLLTNIAVVSAEANDEIYSEMMPYCFSDEYGIDLELEMNCESEEYGMSSQGDDDVELLWSHSGDGRFVFSMFVNDDNNPDILASSYAIDGANGETIFQFEAGEVIGVGDINNDGEDEIISCIAGNDTGNSTIYCLDSSNGIIIWERVVDSRWVCSVSIGDTAGDENNEVVVGVGDVAERNNNYVYCLDGNSGDTIWRRHAGDHVYSTAVDDVNADDKNEVLAGTGNNDPRFYCLDGDTGNVIWEVVKQMGVNGFRSICVGELNQDIYKEIIVDLAENDDYGILCISGNNGSTLWSWNQEPDGDGIITNGPFQSILIADMIPSISGSEVLAGGVCGVYCLYGGNDSSFDERVIWHAGRANEIVMTFVMSMDVGDLDQDGLLDVVAITIPWMSGNGNVYAVHGQYGSLLWMYENCTAGGYHSIICKDVTGDGVPEVVAKDESFVCVLLNSFPTNNQNPNIPTINSTDSGYIFLSYNYTAITDDPDWDDLYYYLNWGDGTRTTSKVGASGETVIVPNSWKKEGNYTVKAKTIDEHGAESSWSDPLYVVMIYIPSTVNITKPDNFLYINNRDIKPTSKPDIVGDLDIIVNATDEIYGINRVEFYIDDEIKATDFTEPYSWTWDEKGFGNHVIKVVAINKPGIKETDNITVYKSSGGSELDQIQTECNGALSVGGAVIDNIYKNFSTAQSFIPTKSIITKIYLYIKMSGAFNPYLLAIKEDLEGETLAVASVDRDEIGMKFGWIGFDFGELKINPGQTYYMVSYTSKKPIPYNSYGWGNFYSDVYPNGSSYKLYFNKIWIEHPDIDMCFRIQGRDSLLPNTPTINGPKVGISGLEYEYTINTITLSYPEEDQIYYYVDWGENNYSGWVGPYIPGETAYVKHTWTSPGIYEVKVIVKDNEELLSDWSESFFVYIDFPFEPSNPVPPDGWVYRVNGQNPNWPMVLLSWNGGDPNEDDMVNYDIYFGQNSNDLPYTATVGPYLATQTQIGPYDLGVIDNPGIYYWKIVSRDDHGNEMEGPIWHFIICLCYPPSQQFLRSSPQSTQGSSPTNS